MSSSSNPLPVTWYDDDDGDDNDDDDKCDDDGDDDDGDNDDVLCETLLIYIYVCMLSFSLIRQPTDDSNGDDNLSDQVQPVRLRGHRGGNIAGLRHFAPHRTYLDRQECERQFDREDLQGA